jgi:hypothetical protein
MELIIFYPCSLTLFELVGMFVTGQKQANVDREAWSLLVTIKIPTKRAKRFPIFTDETRLDEPEYESYRVSQGRHIVLLMTASTVL